MPWRCVRVHVGLLGVGMAKELALLDCIDRRCRISREGRQVISVLMMPTAAQVSTSGMMPTR